MEEKNAESVTPSMHSFGEHVAAFNEGVQEDPFQLLLNSPQVRWATPSEKPDTPGLRRRARER